MLPVPPIAPLPSENDSATEFEVKFSASAETLAQILASNLFDRAALSRPQTIETLYFDDAAGHLLRAGIALRWRKAGRQKPVMTFKSAPQPGKALFERTEIEILAGPEGFDLNRFGEPVVSEVRKMIGERELVARYKTLFKRRKVLVAVGRSTLEVSLDAGHFIANDRESPLHEIEIELKSGDRADVLVFAKGLAEQSGLRLETISKSERCALLAGLKLPRRKFGQLNFTPETPLDTAIAAILTDCLLHFTDHIRPFREEREVNAVHQMRVGLRRLRSALKILGKLLPGASFPVFSRRARDIASGLGLARECDAFRDLAFGHPLAHPKRPKDADALDASLHHLRHQAYYDAQAMIDGGETTQFIIDLQLYIVQRRWRSEISDAQLPLLTAPLDEVARDIIDGLFNRARKRGKHLMHASDEERHEFRIVLKNLRYNASFFAALFEGRKSTKAWNAALADLQNLLGIHNDLAGAATMLDRLKGQAEADFSEAAGFVLGWYAYQSDEADAQLAKAWKRLRGLPRFWA